MMRSFLLFLFLALMSQFAHAQKDKKSNDSLKMASNSVESSRVLSGDTLFKRNGKIRKFNNSFLTLGAGAVFHYIHDPMATPLLYRAAGVSYVNFGYRQRGLRRYNVTEILMGSSMLNDTESGTYYNQSYQFTLKAHYEKYYKYGKKFFHNRIQWWPGAGLDLLINDRYLPPLGNSAHYYDYSLSLSAGTRFEADFKLFKRDFLLGWQLNLPMVSAITRPNYAGITNFVSGDGDEELSQYADNLRVATFNHYFLLRSTVELSYPLGNRNMLMLTYQWQGQNYYHPDYKLQSTYTAVMFHFIFKLDKNKNL